MSAATLDDELANGLRARIAMDRARAERIRTRATRDLEPDLAPLAVAMRRRASELELMVQAHEAILEGISQRRSHRREDAA